MEFKNKWYYLAFFVLTLLTTTLAGAEWMFGRFWVFLEPTLGLREFWQGFHFSIPFLLVLTAHEFGHYFMAKKHKVDVTLPFYLPFWIGIISGIGTLGAFIKIKDKINSRIQYFDIGIAGPLAGFIFAVLLLVYGFSHLPPADYIFTIHPEYKKWGLEYGKYAYQNTEGLGTALVFGDSWLFNFLKNTFADASLLPHPNEMAHYPYLLAGFLALFFTALNLLPIGQLDGGHILYGLIGEKAFNVVSPIFFILFTFYGGLGTYKIDDFLLANEAQFYEMIAFLLFYIYFNYLCFSKLTENKMTNLLVAVSVVIVQFLCSHFSPLITGYNSFLPFAFLLGRFLGIYHPKTENQEPLGTTRIILGWLAILIFIICASAKPFLYV